MSETKQQHTKGPWFIERDEDGSMSCEFTPLVMAGADSYEKGAVGVASVTGRLSDAVANARLIAAAPSLLEALERFIDPEDGHVQACGNGSDDPDDCSPLCRGTRAAIALARGEQ